MREGGRGEIDAGGSEAGFVQTCCARRPVCVLLCGARGVLAIRSVTERRKERGNTIKPRRRRRRCLSHAVYIWYSLGYHLSCFCSAGSHCWAERGSERGREAASKKMGDATSSLILSTSFLPHTPAHTHIATVPITSLATQRVLLWSSSNAAAPAAGAIFIQTHLLTSPLPSLPHDAQVPQHRTDGRGRATYGDTGHDRSRQQQQQQQYQQRQRQAAARPSGGGRHDEEARCV